MKTILIGILIGYASTGWAQTPVCDTGDRKAYCSTPMTRGQTAPYDGQLLSIPLAIELGQKANRCDVELALEKKRYAELTEIDQKLHEKILQLERDGCKQQIHILTKNLEKALDQSVSWYERPLFVSAVSIASTIVIFSLAVKTVDVSSGN